MPPQRLQKCAQCIASESSKGKINHKKTLPVADADALLGLLTTKSGGPALRDSKAVSRTEPSELPPRSRVSREKPARHRENMQTAHKEGRQPNSGQKKTTTRC